MPINFGPIPSLNWIQPNFKGGITEQVRQEIQEGIKRPNYPEPEPGEGLCVWAERLDSEQLVQAYYDTHERWTWESGDDDDRDLLYIIEQEIEMRGDPPTEGDVSFNTNDNSTYCYSGGKWVKFSR